MVSVETWSKVQTGSPPHPPSPLRPIKVVGREKLKLTPTTNSHSFKVAAESRKKRVVLSADKDNATAGPDNNRQRGQSCSTKRIDRDSQGVAGEGLDL